MTSHDTARPLHVARSVERALKLLDLAVTNEGISLADAARAADLPPSTALRHLRALELNGFLTRTDGGAFAAGPTVVRLALTALNGSPPGRLAQVAQPFLVELSHATAETTYLAVPESPDLAVYLAHQESTREIRHVGWLGKQVTRHKTAVGLALSGEVAEGEAVTSSGAVESDVNAVAAPVYGRGNAVLAALAVIGPSFRLCDDNLALAVERTRAISAALGRTVRQAGLGQTS